MDPACVRVQMHVTLGEPIVSLGQHQTYSALKFANMLWTYTPVLSNVYSPFIWKKVKTESRYGAPEDQSEQRAKLISSYGGSSISADMKAIAR